MDTEDLSSPTSPFSIPATHVSHRSKAWSFMWYRCGFVVNGLQTNGRLDEYLPVQGFRLLLKAEAEKQKEGMCSVVHRMYSGMRCAK